MLTGILLEILSKTPPVFFGDFTGNSEKKTSGDSPKTFWKKPSRDSTTMFYKDLTTNKESINDSFRDFNFFNYFTSHFSMKKFFEEISQEFFQGKHIFPVFPLDKSSKVSLEVLSENTSKVLLRFLFLEFIQGYL